jgi:hypothetical protein
MSTIQTFERGLGPRRETAAEKVQREQDALEKAQRPTVAEFEAQAAEASRAYMGGSYDTTSDRRFQRRG